MPEARAFRKSRTREIRTSGSTMGEWVALCASPSLLLYRLGERLHTEPRP
jgi:hypothetical protein